MSTIAIVAAGTIIFGVGFIYGNSAVKLALDEGGEV